MLHDVQYGQRDPARQNVVLHWPPDLPKRRDECWYVMTDLDSSAVRLSRLHGQRMTVEQLFRDGNNRRNGGSLRDIRLTRPARLDRLLLVLTLTYLLLCGLGLAARARYDPSAWCSNTGLSSCSVFAISRTLIEHEWLPLDRILAALINAPPNCG